VHQHFFVARMDFAVDGPKNTVVELNAVAEVNLTI
jgi:Cu2+-containing amine oxidase